MSSSSTKSPPLWLLQGQLDLAHAVLSLQRQVGELREQVAGMMNGSTSRSKRIDWKAFGETVQAIARFLATPSGQALLGLLLPILAGLVKWLAKLFTC
jgi:hypothetical protein